MKTCGLDPASSTGLALVGEGEDRGKVLKIKEIRGFHRLHLIAEDLRRTLGVWKPDFVVVERYAYCKNIDAFITLVEIGTVIRNAIYAEKLPWYEVPPTVLKKFVTGKGNADKAQMLEAVQSRWGFTTPSHDINDAYALAQMGQMGQEALQNFPGVFRGDL